MFCRWLKKNFDARFVGFEASGSWIGSDWQFEKWRLPMVESCASV
jgi:hypothetical protein